MSRHLKEKVILLFDSVNMDTALDQLHKLVDVVWHGIFLMHFPTTFS